MNRSSVIAVIAFALLATAGSVSGAAGAQSPLGFKIFCLENPEQCAANSRGSVAMSDELLGTLKKVNLAVNRAIRPLKDRGGKDVWTLEARSGDCEDYVVTKRARLIKAGVAAGSLRIAFAKTRQGVPHAVLVVRTSEGDLVLDNLTNAIRPMSQTGLRFISMSGTNPKKWAAL